MQTVLYTCMALSQNKFVLSNLPLAMNLSKYKKALYFLYKSKKVLYNSFYKNESFLDSGVSIYFTLFESDFVSMTLGNYS